MFRNYIKVAIRTLMKNKLFSAINIFGLALSMSICLLVLLRFKDQLSYDRFHPHPDRTYRIISDVRNSEGNEYHFASSPLPLLDAFSRETGYVAHSTRLYMPGKVEASLGRKRLEMRKLFADTAFFQVFGFGLALGNEQVALAQPNSIVLSEEMAARFFGSEPAMGKTITLKNWGEFNVTGVMKPMPGKSHIEFDALLSMSSVPVLEKGGQLAANLDRWNMLDKSYTYLTVKPGVSESQLHKALTSFSNELMSKSNVTGKERMVFRDQRLSDIILGEELFNSIGNTGSKGKTWAEIAIAFVILLSACFNYTNLSIARSLQRGKEIGVRKVSGAFRIHIFWQFIIESLLVSLLSLGLAYIFLQLIIDHAPFSSELVPAGFHFDAGLFAWFLAFAVFTSLLAGALPAWSLSSFKPVQVLKNLSTIRLFGGNGFRKALIISQFTLSLVIIIFSQIFTRQFNYMDKADPGFARENRIGVRIHAEDAALLSTELARISGVDRVAASSSGVGRDASGTSLLKREPTDQSFAIPYYDVDTAFLSLMNLRIMAGNNFPANSNMGRESFVMLNELAAKQLKFKSAAESVGQTVWLNDSLPVQVAGVVNDFYFRGVDQPIQPLLLRSRPAEFRLLTIKLSGSNAGAIAAIGQVWSKYNPGETFSYDWLEPNNNAWGTISILGFLAIIAITLACLGLLGMVTYNIERRRKEIGIRKIMGADTATIVTFLSKGFIRLVLIAGCIALPISYLLGYFFLNLFANRIQLGFMTQLVSLGGLLLVALLTMGTQIFRAATANPAESIRTE